MKRVNGETFDTEVLQSDTPVVVDFCSSWAGTCNYEPILESIASEHGDKIKFVRITCETNMELVAEYGIEVRPTIVLFKNGNIAKVNQRRKSRQEWLDFLGLDE